MQKKLNNKKKKFPLSTHKTSVHADGFGIIVLFVTAVV